MKSKFFEQNSASPENKDNNQKELKICIKPPPPPPAPLSPSATVLKSPLISPSNFSLEAASKHEALESTKEDSKNTDSSENQSTQEDVPDDDFGDFQTAV